MSLTLSALRCLNVATCAVAGLTGTVLPYLAHHRNHAEVPGEFLSTQHSLRHCLAIECQDHVGQLIVQMQWAFMTRDGYQGSFH